MFTQLVNFKIKILLEYWINNMQFKYNNNNLICPFIQGLAVLMCFPLRTSIIVLNKINTTYVFLNAKYQIFYGHTCVFRKKDYVLHLQKHVSIFFLYFFLIHWKGEWIKYMTLYIKSWLTLHSLTDTTYMYYITNLTVTLDKARQGVFFNRKSIVKCLLWLFIKMRIKLL